MHKNPPRPIDWRSSPTLTTLREAVGAETTRLIVQVWGGTILRLPVRAEGSRLCAVVGPQKTAAIVAAFAPGERLVIPTGRGEGWARRLGHHKIHEMYDNNASIRQIARAMGCTMRHVRRILSKTPPPSSQSDFGF